MTPIKRLVLLAIVLGAAAGGFACSGLIGGSWEAPLVVKIQSEEDVAALTPTGGVWSEIGEGGEPQGLLLRDGDYFFADEWPIRYLESDGLDLKVTFTDWSAKIGDKTVAVLLNKGKPEDGAWLKSATDQQLADIRTLGVGNEIDAAAMAALKRIAALNPKVDLFIESGGALPQLLPLFKPRAVFAPESLDAGDRQALANQGQIEMLLIKAEKPGSLDFLSTLPALRTLLIAAWDVKVAGPLPASLSGLKTLLVMDSDELTNLTPLGGAATGLEELTLIGLDNFTDITGIEKMTNLHTLFLFGDKIGDLSGLAGLKELRWVGLPPELSQAQFAAFVGAHPKLAILDMMGNETVTDLTPLNGLKDLRGLVLDGPYTNLNAVQALTSLQFVGVSRDVWRKMPDQVAAVQKALPGALIVKIRPLCLGSGWILVLVPVPFVAWLVRRTRAARAAA